MKKLFFFFALTLALALTGCESDDSFEYNVTNKTGYYVVNEGSFGNSNASVGFLGSDGNYHEDLFFRTNKRVLGDVFQSICFHNGLAYLVMNGSHKIELMDANNFREKGTIEGFSNPRYMVVSGGYGYVSQWGDYSGNAPSVKVVDLSTKKIVKTIPTGAGSERMLVYGNHILVANSGGYGSNNTITVIDATTREELKTVTLTDSNPMGFVVDKNEDIWVLCYGSVTYAADWTIESETPSALVRLSKSTFEPVSSLTISNNSHPSQLAINPDGDVLYFGGGYGFQGIFAMQVDAAQTPSSPLIDKSVYSFSVNPENGEIVALFAPSFTQVGQIVRYQPNGTQISVANAGIGPNAAIYKN